MQTTFLRKWRNSGHVKCRCRIIGRLIFIKVLWESFHPNTPIKGELFQSKALSLSSSCSLISRDLSSLNRIWLQSMLSLPPEIYQLNTSPIFSSRLPSHVRSIRDASRDIFSFTLSISVNLVFPFHLIRLIILQQSRQVLDVDNNSSLKLLPMTTTRLSP